MHSRTRLMPLAAILFFGLSAISSCAGQYSSYAVLIWSPDESRVKSGSIVGITAHSELKNSYDFVFVDSPETAKTPPSSVTPPVLAGAASDNSSSPGTGTIPAVSEKPIFTVDSWRLKVFGNEGAARSWVKDHAIYSRQFARSLKQALPVREKADRNSEMSYRMREGELAKVVDRMKDESDEGGLRGYWYQILTETGLVGWVFSAQLDVVDLAATGGTAIVSDDSKLQQILTANWRPEEFAGMIEYKRFDLSIFSPRNGLFFDAAKKVIHLVLPKEQSDFTYTSIDKLRNDTYQVSGTTLQLSFRDDTSIVAQWVKSSAVKSHVFVSIGDSITDLYNSEVARRDSLYTAFLANGGNMQSDTYGSISLNQDKTFQWSNLSSLQPRIVPTSANGSGTVDFGYYLGPSLIGQYQGVITFSFNTNSDPESVSFLYNIRQDGIQLEYVRTTGLRDLVIPRTELSPTVLFFHY